MKYYECLPQNIGYYIATLNDVRELRVRNGKPIRINVGGKWYFVGERVLTQNVINSIVLGDVCDEIVNTACNNSIYAYERMLAQGYFTLEDGCRIGVVGRVAGVDANIFQRYTSLCFRIPHCVNCVDDKTVMELSKGSVIVIGPPNSGKTTFLRDFAAKLSQTKNVLVVDERGELFYDDEVTRASNCDVIKWSSKEYGFQIGVRSMSPDAIICDEISESDIPYIRSTQASGVTLACSAHGNDLEDFIKRFSDCRCFDKAVILNKDMSYSVRNAKFDLDYTEK